MYDAKKYECTFFEQYSNETKYTQHLVIECIPLPNNVSNLAPIYFKVKSLYFKHMNTFEIVFLLYVILESNNRK